jgi:hypothetical protein
MRTADCLWGPRSIGRAAPSHTAEACLSRQSSLKIRGQERLQFTDLEYCLAVNWIALSEGFQALLMMLIHNLAIHSPGPLSEV